MTETVPRFRVGQTVARGDQREPLQRRRLVLGADPHEHVALAERGLQHAEQRDAALEHVHQLVDLAELPTRCSVSSRAAPST